jgi:hypothetical protein
LTKSIWYFQSIHRCWGSKWFIHSRRYLITFNLMFQVVVWEAGDIRPVKIGPDKIDPANRTGRNRTLRNRPTLNFFKAVLLLRQSGPFSSFYFLSSMRNSKINSRKFSNKFEILHLRRRIVLRYFRHRLYFLP